MKREEMVKRLQAGEDALDLSIEKWTDIVEACEKGKFNEASDLDEAEHNCALCKVYQSQNCAGCPIRKATREQYCDATPYDGWRRETDKVDKVSKMLQMAKDELEFLKKLKSKQGSTKHLFH